MIQFRLPAVLGAVIRTERIARGMTQQQLAESAGLHPMTFSKIERGIQQDIGVETLSCIARALSMTASAILATAEQWRMQLYVELEQGRLPAAETLNSAALAAIVLLAKAAKVSG